MHDESVQPSDTPVVDVSDTSSDDITVETYTDDDAASVKDAGAAVKKLKAEIAVLKAERQEYLDGWQRIKADFANLKKREEEGRAEFAKFAREGMISDLLPVLESFNMAFANKESWERVDANWRMGVEYIHKELMRVMSESGLMELTPRIGAAFDPNTMTAVETVETLDAKQYHMVARVIQSGYTLNGKLLKSPRVAVYGEHAA